MSIPVVSTIACRSHSYWPAVSPSSLNSDSDSDSDISPLLRRSLLLYFIVAHCPVLGPFVYVIQQIENSSMHCEYVPFFSPLYLLCLQIDTIAFQRYIHICMYVCIYILFSASPFVWSIRFLPPYQQPLGLSLFFSCINNSVQSAPRNGQYVNSGTKPSTPLHTPAVRK